MKIDSKRRWKARILEERDIPGYVTTLYPELLFWLTEYGYTKGGAFYVKKAKSRKTQEEFNPSPASENL